MKIKLLPVYLLLSSLSTSSLAQEPVRLRQLLEQGFEIKITFGMSAILLQKEQEAFACYVELNQDDGGFTTNDIANSACFPLK